MNQKTILIIDDESSIRDMYAHAFETAGMHVLAAESGKRGVEVALTEHPDAILVDIDMPDLNGHAVVEMIRSDAWGKDACIVFLTNIDSAESIIHATNQRSNKYLVKADTTPSDVVRETSKLLEEYHV